MWVHEALIPSRALESEGRPWASSELPRECINNYRAQSIIRVRNQQLRDREMRLTCVIQISHVCGNDILVYMPSMMISVVSIALIIIVSTLALAFARALIIVNNFFDKMQGVCIGIYRR